MTSKAAKRTPAPEPDAELGHLLEDAANASPETRIEYGTGLPPTVPTPSWPWRRGWSRAGRRVRDRGAGGDPKTADDLGAASALRRIATKAPDWADIAQQALARIGASAVPPPRSSPRRPRPPAATYMATGRRRPQRGRARSEPRRFGVPQPRPPPDRGRLGPAPRTGRPRHARPSRREGGCSREQRPAGQAEGRELGPPVASPPVLRTVLARGRTPAARTGLR